MISYFDNVQAVLMSIQPKFCELIANRTKTIEIRKSRPKLETPFKCYIYCTLNGINEFIKGIGIEPFYRDNWYVRKGKVIGEFVCDKVYNITPHYDIPKFCNQYECGWKVEEDDACLSFEKLAFYLKGKNGYGWHISDLVIYDKPKELGEFRISDIGSIKQCDNRHQVGQPEHETANGGWIKGGYYCVEKDDWCDKCKTKPIIKPPQSWCYVEEKENV